MTNDEQFRFGAVAVGVVVLIVLVYRKFSRSADAGVTSETAEG